MNKRQRLQIIKRALADHGTLPVQKLAGLTNIPPSTITDYCIRGNLKSAVVSAAGQAGRSRVVYAFVSYRNSPKTQRGYRPDKRPNDDRYGHLVADIILDAIQTATGQCEASDRDRALARLWLEGDQARRWADAINVDLEWLLKEVKEVNHD